MKIIALLLLTYLSMGIVLHINTAYAFTRNKSEWRLGRWFNQKWINCWVKLSGAVFVATVFFVIAVGIVAEFANAPLVGKLLDAWFWTRLPVWFILTMRAKRQAHYR